MSTNGSNGLKIPIAIVVVVINLVIGGVVLKWTDSVSAKLDRMTEEISKIKSELTGINAARMADVNERGEMKEDIKELERRIYKN